MTHTIETGTVFHLGTHFYPRYAMLARVIAIAACLSVRPSVTRRYCVKTKKASWFLHYLVAPRF